MWSERKLEQLKLQVEKEKWKILGMKVSGNGSVQYLQFSRQKDDTASQNSQGIRTDRQRKRDRDLRIGKSELACMSCTA